MIYAVSCTHKTATKLLTGIYGVLIWSVRELQTDRHRHREINEQSLLSGSPTNICERGNRIVCERSENSNEFKWRKKMKKKTAEKII